MYGGVYSTICTSHPDLVFLCHPYIPLSNLLVPSFCAQKINDSGGYYVLFVCMHLSDGVPTVDSKSEKGS